MHICILHFSLSMCIRICLQLATIIEGADRFMSISHHSDLRIYAILHDCTHMCNKVQLSQVLKRIRAHVPQWVVSVSLLIRLIK